MMKYLIRDLWNVVHYMPYVLAAGGLICLFAFPVAWVQRRRGKETGSLLPGICFWTYLLLLLTITFLSRESNGNIRIDLQIGSSLGINARNDAYVIENILLFVPYGFFYTMMGRHRSGFRNSLFIGLLTSFGVECLQLVSGRGIFQIDDIITNTVGCVFGFLICKVIYMIVRK